MSPAAVVVTPCCAPSADSACCAAIQLSLWRGPAAAASASARRGQPRRTPPSRHALRRPPRPARRRCAGRSCPARARRRSARAGRSPRPARGASEGWPRGAAQAAIARVSGKRRSSSHRRWSRVAAPDFATPAILGREGLRDRPHPPIGTPGSAPVAQLDRASDYESEGRTFESFRARHFSFRTGAGRPANQRGRERPAIRCRERAADRGRPSGGRRQRWARVGEVARPAWHARPAPARSWRVVRRSALPMRDACRNGNSIPSGPLPQINNQAPSCLRVKHKSMVKIAAEIAGPPGTAERGTKETGQANQSVAETRPLIARSEQGMEKASC